MIIFPSEDVLTLMLGELVPRLELLAARRMLRLRPCPLVLETSEVGKTCFEDSKLSLRELNF